MSKIMAMDARIKDLEIQLNQNSQNSHRPPSSDGYRKRPMLARKPKGSKGGKPGHDGKTLKMVEKADHYWPVYPEQCSCGASLKGEDMALQARRQVFDLPEPKLEVTEYQTYSCRCPQCHRQAVGQFPQGVYVPAQYGPRVKALTNLLYAGHHLSHQSIGELFHDMYGYELNEGTIQSAAQELYGLTGGQ